MLRTQRARKGPGWLGLRLNTAGEPPECLRPWRSEDQVQDPSWLTGPEWVGEMLGTFPPSFSPRGPLPTGLSSSSPCLPPMPLEATRLEGAPEARGPDPEAQQASRGEWVGKTPFTPPLIPEGPSLSAFPPLPPLLPPSYTLRTPCNQRGLWRMEDHDREPSRLSRA